MSVRLTHTGQQLDAAITKVENDYADVSGVTALASDVAEGTYYVNSDGNLVAGTAIFGRCPHADVFTNYTLSLTFYPSAVEQE